MKAKRGFTLIELLFTMAIIAILVAMLLPAFRLARETAKKRRAKTEVNQIAMAWESLLNDYRTWDKGGVSVATPPTSMNSVSVALLRGTTNLRKIMYMEFDANSLDAGDNYVDPWDQVYLMMLDDDYDNQILTALPAPDDVVYRRVAVWSTGGAGTNAAEFIRSWR